MAGDLKIDLTTLKHESGGFNATLDLTTHLRHDDGIFLRGSSERLTTCSTVLTLPVELLDKASSFPCDVLLAHSLSSGLHTSQLISSRLANAQPCGIIVG